MLTSQMSAVWEPRAQACLRLHTHAGLLQNSVMLGSEVFFLMLMAGGIYMRKSGRYAFKIIYREVRGDRCRLATRKPT